MTNITGCKNEDLHIDMPVEVTFDDVTDEITIPKFKPIVQKITVLYKKLKLSIK